MSRDLPIGLPEAIGQRTVRPFIAAHMDFEGGVVRVSSWNKAIAFDEGGGSDETYDGLGNLASVSSVEEGTQLQAYNVDLGLSGVRDDMIALALAEEYQGRTVRLFYGLLDEDEAPVAQPIEIFSGQMDVMDIERGGGSTITLRCVDERADWERPRMRRWNRADHRRRYPDDAFLDVVDRAAEREIFWGVRPT